MNDIEAAFLHAEAERALARLLEGNHRFLSGRSEHDYQSATWREQLVATQKPFATILGCADSRIPPELIFDQGFGDLFVIRVAGNVLGDDVIGSLEYAVHHVKTPLIVVLGHEGYGAVTAAVQAMLRMHGEPHYIEALIGMIEPGLVDLYALRVGLCQMIKDKKIYTQADIDMFEAERQRAIDRRTLEEQQAHKRSGPSCRHVISHWVEFNSDMFSARLMAT